jgi:hypothetical protein
MKIGDLVIMPRQASKRVGDEEVGLIVNDEIIRDRIGVLWTDGAGRIDYEPVDWLEVISEGR